MQLEKGLMTGLLRKLGKITGINFCNLALFSLTYTHAHTHLFFFFFFTYKITN